MGIELTNYQKRVKAALFVYGIFSLIIVPAFTLFMGTRDNILTVSMSAMGNTNGRYMLFVIWTITFCGYFGSFIGYLLMLTKNTHSKVRILVGIALVVLIFGNCMPFVPKEWPLPAFLHDLCAQISSISLAVTLMLFALTLRSYYPSVFKKALTFVLIIWVMLLVLMGVFGTKAITEMTGIILACIYLHTVAHWLMKQEDFDAAGAIIYKDAEEAAEDVKKLTKKEEELGKELASVQQKLGRARVQAQEAIAIAKEHSKTDKHIKK